jgi:hypothetical protein
MLNKYKGLPTYDYVCGSDCLTGDTNELSNSGSVTTTGKTAAYKWTGPRGNERYESRGHSLCMKTLFALYLKLLYKGYSRKPGIPVA